jgi:hypothetical protein
MGCVFIGVPLVSEIKNRIIAITSRVLRDRTRIDQRRIHPATGPVRTRRRRGPTSHHPRHVARSQGKIRTLCGNHALKQAHPLKE